MPSLGITVTAARFVRFTGETAAEFERFQKFLEAYSDVIDQDSSGWVRTLGGYVIVFRKTPRISQEITDLEHMLKVEFPGAVQS
jgi:hypothetical protein